MTVGFSAYRVSSLAERRLPITGGVGGNCQARRPVPVRTGQKRGLHGEGKSCSVEPMFPLFGSRIVQATILLLGLAQGDPLRFLAADSGQEKGALGFSGDCRIGVGKFASFGEIGALPFLSRRVAELVALLVGVFAGTFLLAKAAALPVGSVAAPASPGLSEFARLMRLPPDEHIELPFYGMRVREIGDSWHEPRSGHRKHEGQDIFAPIGTPIYSATSGIVSEIATTPKGGNNVSVLGAGGRVYYYAHLSRFAADLKFGETVTPETLLGYVGITGNAVGTPPHLHFGVYDYAGAMNPLPLLTNRPMLRSSRREPAR